MLYACPACSYTYELSSNISVDSLVELYPGEALAWIYGIVQAATHCAIARCPKCAMAVTVWWRER